MEHPQLIGYHTFSRRVILRGTLTLSSGLHIGSGRAIGTSATDLPVLKDVDGKPFIPGSSLKGVLRSNVEAFLRAFQGKTKEYLSCCLIGSAASPEESLQDRTRRPCIDDDCKKVLIKKRAGDALIWQKSCWVCRSFGSPWIASKVQIVDLPVVSEWTQELLMVRDGVAIDRESETAAPKQKFDFEVVPPGTQFGVEVLIENPEDYELGMLMLGADMLNDGFALLGGDTSRGLGRVRIDIEEITELTPEILLARLRGETTPVPPEAQPIETSTTQVTEEVEPSGDELQQALRACLEEAGSLDHNGLVTAMQQRGWKSKKELQNYTNWKDLFEKSVKAGIISYTEEQFHLPGDAPTAPEEEQQAPDSLEEEAKVRTRAENERKIKRWEDALYRKLKEAMEL